LLRPTPAAAGSASASPNCATKQNCSTSSGRRIGFPILRSHPSLASYSGILSPCLSPTAGPPARSSPHRSPPHGRSAPTHLCPRRLHHGRRSLPGSRAPTVSTTLAAPSRDSGTSTDGASSTSSSPHWPQTAAEIPPPPELTGLLPRARRVDPAIGGRAIPSPGSGTAAASVDLEGGSDRGGTTTVDSSAVARCR
jgi:hypothetical protein